MTTLDNRDMRGLHESIRAAAAELTEPTRNLVTRDDGTTTLHAAAALLDQLASEAAPGTARPGTGAGASGAPVAIDVIDLQARIRAETAAWCWTLTEQRPATGLGERVQDIAAAAGQLTDRDLLARVHRFVVDWANSVRAVLDPPRRLHLVEPCPACETRIVPRRDPGTGETVRAPALSVDGRTGCSCLACGAVWPPEHLEHLAAVLGCEPVGA